MSEAPPPSAVLGSAAPDDRPIPWIRRLAAASLLPLGLGILWWAAERPGLVEQYYSTGLFLTVRDGLRLFSATLPVPLGQTLLLVLVMLLVGRPIAAARLCLRGRRSAGNLLAHALARLLGLAGLLYAFFLVSWGLNHARLPYAHHAGLDPLPVETGELARWLEELVQETNALRVSVQDAEFQLVPGVGGVDARLAAGYEQLASEIPVLGGGRPLLRRAFLSPMLTALGISGIYSPFTAEAHLNGQLVPWLQPFVCAHELAHFKGFAREDEANFIAWQVCRRSPGLAFRYSVGLVALTHGLIALEGVDAPRAVQVRSLMSAAVLADLAQNREFWASNQSPVSELAQSVNDAYLKSQGQADGRQSYGRMLDLLIAEWKQGQRVGTGD